MNPYLVLIHYRDEERSRFPAQSEEEAREEAQELILDGGSIVERADFMQWNGQRYETMYSLTQADWGMGIGVA